jgi:hypothetical protein
VTKSLEVYQITASRPRAAIASRTGTGLARFRPLG